MKPKRKPRPSLATRVRRLEAEAREIKALLVTVRIAAEALSAKVGAATAMLSANDSGSTAPQAPTTLRAVPYPIAVETWGARSDGDSRGPTFHRSIDPQLR